MDSPAKNVVLVLDSIRSAHNVGSIFRTADAAGIAKIYLCGTTPAPIDRFGRKRNDIAKASLGAEEYIPWEYAESVGEVIEALKVDGCFVVALEQDKRAVDYKAVPSHTHIAVVLGPEVSGITPDILNRCDCIAEIPMLGQKESLNVSVAAGVFLFRMMGI